jgi:hypothetical protein
MPHSIYYKGSASAAKPRFHFALPLVVIFPGGRPAATVVDDESPIERVGCGFCEFRRERGHLMIGTCCAKVFNHLYFVLQHRSFIMKSLAVKSFVVKSWAVAVLIGMSLAIAGPQVAQARQFAGGGHVVHTRRAPVAFHRILPPFRGVHVYRGR